MPVERYCGCAGTRNIRYFTDTDTLHIGFRDAVAAETRDFDEDTPIDIDDEGNISAIIVEYASQPVGDPRACL